MRWMAAVLLFVSTPASATLMRAHSVESLTRAASLVVRGRVLGSAAAWNEAHNRIYTHTEIRLEAVWHSADASPGDTVVVRTLGGVVDGIGQRVSGVPRFEPGSDVVLFLTDLPRGAGYRVVGLSQGAFRVEARPRALPAGEWAVPMTDGIGLVDGPALAPMPLPVLRQQALRVEATPVTPQPLPAAPTMTPGAPPAARPADPAVPAASPPDAASGRVLDRP
jgi:hypothetical protein